MCFEAVKQACLARIDRQAVAPDGQGCCTLSSVSLGSCRQSSQVKSCVRCFLSTRRLSGMVVVVNDTKGPKVTFSSEPPPTDGLLMAVCYINCQYCTFFYDVIVSIASFDRALKTPTLSRLSGFPVTSADSKLGCLLSNCSCVFKGRRLLVPVFRTATCSWQGAAPATAGQDMLEQPLHQQQQRLRCLGRAAMLRLQVGRSRGAIVARRRCELRYAVTGSLAI